MIKTKLCDLLGVKYPIIQAGMGPFSNNQLCIATANAGVLGLLSTSGITSGNKEFQKDIYAHYAKTGGAEPEDDMETILRKVIRQTSDATKASGGIFGLNVMVAAEMKEDAEKIVNTAIELREEDPDLKERFKVIFTSAGDPVGWGDKIKGAGFKWLHVVPSVKGALRCQKAGIDLIVASGHEGGFHTSWEPVHSMTLLPSVVEALEEFGTPVVGAGGFCDGKTLAAALSLGGAGIQMGTRFLATQESDFAQLWKEGIVEAGDRGTLVARGFVGPARWIKTATSKEHQKNTLQHTPELFLDTPGPMTEGALKLIDFENRAIKAVSDGDKELAMFAGGECAQRVNDLPKVQDLVQTIMKDAVSTIKALPSILET
ncbi:MAG: nitronate monooxygenase [Deltaproteobacteria bacterium]|jgi:NAD(P)H-dependent flavin oxidoreductase YrpB (nitropropane dioxygenase family)|nr:nitronate monooxygenase [Deltaproteobacteria bacterium]MBT4091641.1 nitronate monooxygenase [Deltaproteobacteria bacterium]MBT4267478.1 nitronate monooxygenase [Deltaproteobacteria bacterium]MBT4644172.1 nitronate monooxygenase [Deltaproteobacteria bacterium]MBT6500172.1 nitronate monooxygenase [Deltaproteobacteria bacterium]